MQYKLEIQYRNWKKPKNQGLCDLKQITKQQPSKLKVTSSGVIYRNVQDFHLVFLPFEKVPTTEDFQDHEPILLVRQINQTYKITDLKNLQQKIQEPLSVVAPYEHGKSLRLNEKSTIRLGKVTIEVLKIQAKIQPQPASLYKKYEKSLIENIKRISLSNYEVVQEQEQSHQFRFSKPSLFTSKASLHQLNNFSIVTQNPMCKICFSKTIQEKNPLISLCNCTGSAGFVHQQCLKSWIKTRAHQISFEKQGKKSIFRAEMKGFQCQICKQYFSPQQILKFILEGREQQLKQYIILLVKVDDLQQIYVIDLEQIPEIKIGRDCTNDIVTNEITVSREHCIIRYNQTKQFLEIVDLSSKFGTVVKKPSFFLNRNFERLQKGRTLLQFKRNGNNENSFFKKLLICLPQAL